MKKRDFVLLAILAVFIMSFVSADLSIAPTNSLYHMGDELNISITLIPPITTNDFLSVKIICVGSAINSSSESVFTSSEIEIYKAPVNVQAGQKKQISFTAKMDKFLLGSLDGEC